MNDETRSPLLQEVSDLDETVPLAGQPGDGRDSGSASPDQKKGDGDGTDSKDQDGTDGGDSDGTDAGDSDGTDGGDSDGTDGGDSDGTDNA